MFADKNGKKYPICGPEGMRCLGGLKGRLLSEQGMDTQQTCCLKIHECHFP